MQLTMRTSASALVVLFGLLAFSPAVAAPTSAPLNFCNKTSGPVTVAFGYYSPGVNYQNDGNVLTGPFVSQGWRMVQPGACTSLENPFSARFMFWYADNGSGFQPPDNPEKQHFCVRHNAFTFEDENASEAACASAGNWVTAARVDTWVSPNAEYAAP